MRQFLSVRFDRNVRSTARYQFDAILFAENFFLILIASSQICDVCQTANCIYLLTGHLAAEACPIAKPSRCSSARV